MIKKLKDIAYDVNDVIVVLVILALAALLIWNRMGVIMAYPTNGGNALVSNGSVNVSQSQEGEVPGGAGAKTTPDSSVEEEGGQDVAVTPGAVSDGNAATSAGATDDMSTAEQPSDGAESGDSVVADDEYPFAVYINYGETAAQIAQKLQEGGIINDKNEFYDALIAAKAERKLLAGSFIIPRGSTPADIVRILTGA
ncbi:MAG: endolytic transglycosylase MltG [Clostridiales Family XIII bacterium]|jgi:hypothetical protein|nr:endolytic transglycosylase MltG [Clostridiales Family XIII bacterium]